MRVAVVLEYEGLSDPVFREIWVHLQLGNPVHLFLRITVWVEAMGGGTFAPDDLMDGSVRGGAARGSDRAADALARAEAKAEMEGQ